MCLQGLTLVEGVWKLGHDSGTALLLEVKYIPCPERLTYAVEETHPMSSSHGNGYSTI
jgi:hypothetical protein